MSDDPNVMMTAPKAPVAAYANAFRAGRAEAARPAPADNEALGQRIAALTPDQRAAAAGQAEMLSAIGQGLAARSYAERRAILAHMGPHLAARGVAPDALSGFDPTDANLAATVGQAVILRGMLGGPSLPAPSGPPPAGPAPPTE